MAGFPSKDEDEAGDGFVRDPDDLAGFLNELEGKPDREELGGEWADDVDAALEAAKDVQASWEAESERDRKPPGSEGPARGLEATGRPAKRDEATEPPAGGLEAAGQAPKEVEATGQGAMGTKVRGQARGQAPTDVAAPGQPAKDVEAPGSVTRDVGVAGEGGGPVAVEESGADGAERGALHEMTTAAEGSSDGGGPEPGPDPAAFWGFGFMPSAGERGLEEKLLLLDRMGEDEA